MKVSRLQDLLQCVGRNWLSIIAGVALGISVLGAAGPGVALAQSDDASVESLIDQIFAEVFGGGGAPVEVSDSGGDINVGGSMGSTVTMGGGSGSSGGISIGGGSGGSGGGGMSSGTYDGS